MIRRCDVIFTPASTQRRSSSVRVTVMETRSVGESLDRFMSRSPGPLQWEGRTSASPPAGSSRARAAALCRYLLKGFAPSFAGVEPIGSTHEPNWKGDVEGRGVSVSVYCGVVWYI